MELGIQTLFSAILGVVQGLAEFLPISSSGHLIVAEKLMMQVGYLPPDTLLTSILLHAGTLIAVIVIFWEDWMRMLRHPIKSRTLPLLFLASLPALVIKILLGDTFDTLFTGWFLGISFIITGCMLTAVDVIRMNRARHQAESNHVSPARALVMGVFQGIALLPGVSRSGSTILGGVASGLSLKHASKFSFMMSAPAIVAGLATECYDLYKAGGMVDFNPLNALVGIVFAALSGYFAIRYMLNLLGKVAFRKFAIYVFILGAAVIVCQLTGFLNLFPPIEVPKL